MSGVVKTRVALLSAAALSLPAQTGFELVRQNCFVCHSTAKATSGLVLETREGLLAGGNRGPGKVAAALRHEGDVKMPPGRKLPPADIAAIEKWLAEGSPYPEAKAPAASGPVHWAFRKPVRVSPPSVRLRSWGRNPIDRFILARLEREGLTPSPEADRATLLRRISLDVTGLPPTVEEMDRREPYERILDRLLASPHFGERWGRHWLDQARYADSDGGSRDEPRQIWKYRDWVIAAINAGMPFDQFLTEQIAGDLLPAATPDQIVATGFLRNHQIQIEAGTDREQYRVESVFDRVDTVGTVFLGISVGCARCHDHKFDPVTQRNYYELFAHFNNCDEWDNSKPPYAAGKNLDVVQGPILDLGNGVKSMVFRELAKPRETYVMLGGDFLRKGVPVQPGAPAGLHKVDRPQRNRLDLARWLTDPANPLTARVAVNRVWQQYFGRGLVETDNDFGTQGSAPSHPELLDWLAVELVENNWDVRRIHRLILESAAYRQASRRRADADAVDPDNRLLARQSRLRLESEIVRDSSLAASGLLSRKVGGPGVFPPQPANAMAASQLKKEWKTSTGEDRYRRGIYTFYFRVTPHPALTVFDQPNATQACTRRNRSNTPLQALTLLNDQAYHEFAQALGARLLREAPADDADRIDLGFRLTVGRRPEPKERERMLRLVRLERDEFQSRPEEAGKLAGRPDAELATWTSIARVLLNTDEFITRE